MKKYLNHEKSLENILNKTTKKLFKDKGFHIFKLMSDWHVIAPNYADLCEPVNLINYSGGYILELAVANEAQIFELQYCKEEIIEIITNYFGMQNSLDIKFRLKSLETEQVKKAKKKKAKKEISREDQLIIDEITDNSLKNVLASIARLIK